MGPELKHFDSLLHKQTCTSNLKHITKIDLSVDTTPHPLFIQTNLESRKWNRKIRFVALSCIISVRLCLWVVFFYLVKVSGLFDEPG